MTGLGHEAVVIFFVISGLLVGGLTLERWQEKGVQMRSYFANRTSRIYTVLLPALLVGGALDYAGWKWFDGSGMYSNAEIIGTNSLKAATHEDLRLGVLIGNVLMLESHYVPVFGTNGPVWSLAYEWWYYCLFAFFLNGLLVKKWRAASWAGVVFIAVMAPVHLLLMGLIWLMGIGVLYYGRSGVWRLPAWVCGVLLVAALGASRFNTHGGSTDVRYDMAIGVAYALLLVALYKREKPVWGAGLHHKLADFSYTLYLAHFPMLIFWVAVAHDVLGVALMQQPDAGRLAYFGAVVAGLVVYSWLFAQLTERHTPKVRAWLLGRNGR